MVKRILTAVIPLQSTEIIFGSNSPGIIPMNPMYGKSQLCKRKMNTELLNNLYEYLNKIDFIKYNLEDIPERDSRIYFIFNMNTNTIYCIAFDEAAIQKIYDALVNTFPNPECIMYDYKQY